VLNGDFDGGGGGGFRGVWVDAGAGADPDAIAGGGGGGVVGRGGRSAVLGSDCGEGGSDAMSSSDWGEANVARAISASQGPNRRAPIGRIGFAPRSEGAASIRAGAIGTLE